MSARGERRKAESKRETSVPAGFMRLALRVLWIVAAWIAAPLLLAGLAVRFTVRDEVDVLAVIFYATPLPVLWALSVICLIYWWPLPRIRFVALLLTGGCLGLWIFRGFGFAPPFAGTVENSFRIAYWNVARPEWRLPSVL